MFCSVNAFEKHKIKVLPLVGNTFERYGHLSKSMILYKEGHFKLTFLYFNRKPLLLPKKKNERKNTQNSKTL